MTKKKKEFDFKKAYQELEDIVSDFEAKEIDLEADLPKFERGLVLAKGLQQRLKEIENEVKTINKKFSHDDQK